MFLSALIWMGLLSPISHASPIYSPSAKPVVASIEILPNYLLHLFVVGGVWESADKSYARRQAGTVQQADRDFLKAHRESIAWGNLADGGFKVRLFFFPAYKGFSTKKELQDYFEALVSASKKGDFKEFERTYGRINEPFRMELDQAKNRPDDLLLLHRFAQIIVMNFPTYRDHVWPSQKRSLDRIAAKVDLYFQERDHVGEWEQVLRMPLPVSQWQVILTAIGGNDVPSANNLSRDRYQFYCQPDDFKGLVGMIDHEIGTDILSPTFWELFKDDDLTTRTHAAGLEPRQLFYKAFENLAEFSKSRLGNNTQTFEGPMLDGKGSFEAKTFFAIYAEVLRRQPALNGQQLLRKGIEAYLQAHQIRPKAQGE